MTGQTHAERLGHLRHPPRHRWPEADRLAFDAIFSRDDVFEDEAGAGAHLSDGSRRHIESGYGRWLAFLRMHDEAALDEAPLERVTRARLRQFVAVLRREVRLTTAASIIDGLRNAVRLMDSGGDFDWLRRLQRRLQAEAEPLNRFPNLTPTPQTYAFGVDLMERARAAAPAPHLLNEIAYRDGLVIALLSLWPIRRRSLASLTVDRHVDRHAGGVTLRLYPQDTKARRAEAFILPGALLAFFEHYLSEVRPRLMRAGRPGAHSHQALWVSQRGTPLTADRLYASVRRQIAQAFGRPMGLHDFRRSAATTVALERPELAALIPGILQHAGTDIGDRHYKLAGSARACRRFRRGISQLSAGGEDDIGYWKTD